MFEKISHFSCFLLVFFLTFVIFVSAPPALGDSEKITAAKSVRLGKARRQPAGTVRGVFGNRQRGVDRSRALHPPGDLVDHHGLELGRIRGAAFAVHAPATLVQQAIAVRPAELGQLLVEPR